MSSSTLNTDSALDDEIADELFLQKRNGLRLQVTLPGVWMKKE